MIKNNTLEKDNNMNIREREQLEYIHSVLQECSNRNIDNVMISQALEYVEIIREQHFKEDV